MPNRKTFDDSERYDHSSHPVDHAEKGDLSTTPHDRTADQPIPEDGTVSTPGGFTNDPDDPSNPNEAIEKFRRRNLRPGSASG
jgi:hypothetical protein